jgi:hypothetical protein
MNGKTEIVELDVTPWDILALSNNQIISSNRSSKCITIYDHNLNLIRKVSKINGEDFESAGIEINEEEKTLFISDILKHQVLKTDFDLNKIKSCGEKGNNFNQFDLPVGICFRNNYLYICDFNNSRVQILTNNLEYVNSIKVEYNPWTIKASKSKSILCVESYSPAGLYVYNLKNMCLLYKYNHDQCRLSEIDSFIYEFNRKSHKVYCYDKNGKLENEILLSDASNLTDNFDGALIYFNGKLIMTCYGKKKFIRFS